MTETSKGERKDWQDEVELFAQQIETRIIEGKAELLGISEREWLVKMLGNRGIDISVVRGRKTETRAGAGVHALIAQGDKLEKALGGRNELIDYLVRVIGRTTNKDGVDINEYVRNYFKKHEYDGGNLINYDLNSGNLLDARIVAFVSATHRLLVYLSSGEAVNDQAQKYLRERVIKGWEKAGKGRVVLPRLAEVSRCDDNLTRSIPVGAVAVILDELTKELMQTA